MKVSLFLSLLLFSHEVYLEHTCSNTLPKKHQYQSTKSFTDDVCSAAVPDEAQMRRGIAMEIGYEKKNISFQCNIFYMPWLWCNHCCGFSVAVQIVTIAFNIRRVYFVSVFSM